MHTGSSEHHPSAMSASNFVGRLTRKFDGFWAIAIVALPATLLFLALCSALFTTTPSPDTFRSCNNIECTLQIPRIIHQTYKNKNLPESWAETPAIWKEQHPGWSYEFWDDERNRKFIADNYAWFLPQFDAYPNNIQRADSIRYFILLHYGGVYADMDIQPMRNIEPMLGDAELVLPETPNLGLTNAFMASVPNHPFMKLVTEELGPHANRWYHFTRHWQILTSTGPTFIWKLADEWGGPYLRVPASVWGKCKICQSSCPVLRDGYLRHLHGDSWHNWDSWFFTYVIFCHQYTLILLGTALALAVAMRASTVAWILAHREIVMLSLGCFVLLMFFQG
ncbi:uncharacterized protein MONBRDRAFT_8658 [Monosiga brevicollis MX1]|uniref:Glycosyltransferase family 32 protein n=1 Tax=Monosiga brevicollis TaxID=81824 RepID=A9V0Q9_MONBE|nr:uncharacterized protein MONBRDRAFT_8658 [Monosiga brevicollis MX1]EDQ88680.1 predicted protein [Monosiga brevicollis MX1]|eukprot:XP_001746293.1 hypothetical protein [Monosiga brevicollis MX1]